MGRLTILIICAAASFNAFASALKDEIDCLALNIYHEARGESHTGQIAVAYVTMNRVVSGRYPNNVCDVIWQSKQFSWTHDGRSDRPTNERSWQRSLSIATYIYTNYFRFMRITKGATDITRGALYYYAPKKVSPSWARRMVATAEIGRHIFLKESS